MTTAKEILITGLKAMGADGIYNYAIDCGCGVDNFIPRCDGCELHECVPAKLNKDDNVYYPMEEQ